MKYAGEEYFLFDCARTECFYNYAKDKKCKLLFINYTIDKNGVVNCGSFKSVEDVPCEDGNCNILHKNTHD